MKEMQGTVVSLKNQKTAIVLVGRQWQHPVYKKYVKRTKKYACHVEGLELHEGDLVSLKSVSPISKTKRFQVVQKVGA